MTSRVFHHLQPCSEKTQISIPALCRAADCFQMGPTPPLQTQTIKEQRRVIACRHGASLSYLWSGLKFVLSFPTRTRLKGKIITCKLGKVGNNNEKQNIWSVILIIVVWTFTSCSYISVKTTRFLKQKPITASTKIWTENSFKKQLKS